jgi:hypothetical protein
MNVIDIIVNGVEVGFLISFVLFFNAWGLYFLFHGMFGLNFNSKK